MRFMSSETANLDMMDVCESVKIAGKLPPTFLRCLCNNKKEHTDSVLFPPKIYPPDGAGIHKQASAKSTGPRGDVFVSDMACIWTHYWIHMFLQSWHLAHAPLLSSTVILSLSECQHSPNSSFFVSFYFPDRQFTKTLVKNVFSWLKWRLMTSLWEWQHRGDMMIISCNFVSTKVTTAITWLLSVWWHLSFWVVSSDQWLAPESDNFWVSLCDYNYDYMTALGSLYLVQGLSDYCYYWDWRLERPSETLWLVIVDC